MSEIRVVVAEEGLVYVFATQEAHEAWALDSVPTYVRVEAASSDERAIAASAVDRVAEQPLPDEGHRDQDR